MIRRPAAPALVLAALAVAAPAAAAATPVPAEVAGGRLVAGVGAADADPVHLALLATPGGVRLEERSGRGLAPGPGALAAGCAAAPGALDCPAGAVPAALLTGGAGDDRLQVAAPVATRVGAGAGADVVDTRGGAQDEVACGLGPDRADADPADRVGRRTCEVVGGPADTDPPRLRLVPPPPGAAAPASVAVDCGEPCALGVLLRVPASPLTRLALGHAGDLGVARADVVLPTGELGPRPVRLTPSAALPPLAGRVAAEAVLVATDAAGNRVEQRVAVPLGPARSWPLLVGRSVRGRPLVALLPPGPAGLLVVGAVHGNEPASARALAAAVARAGPDGLRAVTVVAANPDGLAAASRVNARGVDLNRNMPSRDWGRAPARRPGPRSASEPETRALLRLVEALRPTALVTVHDPLALVEDPDRGPLGRWLARRAGLPLRRSVGYATPGSIGTWARERGLPEVTLELARGGPREREVAALAGLLAGRAPGGEGGASRPGGWGEPPGRGRRAPAASVGGRSAGAA